MDPTMDSGNPEEQGETAPDNENSEPAAPMADKPMAMGPSEAVDLCEFLKTDERSKIALQVCDDFDADVASNTEHMRRQTRWAELYAGVLKPKSFPFEKCANVIVPILKTGVLQVQGRLYDMVIPSKGDIFHSFPTSQHPDELDRANRTEAKLNYLCRHEIGGFAQVYDEVLFQMTLCGSAFDTYAWNEHEQIPEPECIPLEDFVVPANAKSKSPSLRGVARYTRIRWMTYYDIVDKADEGFFYDNGKDEGVAKLDPKSTGDTASTPDFKETVKKISGLNGSDDSTEEQEDRQILEMHIRWLRLPNRPIEHPSLDGNLHAVIAFVEAETQELLRLIVREEPDPKDAPRFQRETEAHQTFVSQQQAYIAAQGVTVDPMTQQLIQLPMPVEAPKPKPQRVREITFFTHYRAFPSQGFYGMGYGDMIGPLNEAMNALVNQNIDRGTINNARGGFRSRQLRFPAGGISMQPGQYTEVDAPPAAMKDGLQTFPAIPEDTGLVRIVEKIEQWAEKCSGSGDTLSGEPIGSNETAKGAVLRHQEAQKQINVLGDRVIAYMKNDVEMIWRILSVFMEDDPASAAMGKDGQPTNIPISRADFIADARVFPVADPRITSQDMRIADSDNTFQWAMANPMMAQNPQIMRALTERGLHARQMTDMIPMLPQPGPPPPPPPVDQVIENADFLQGKQPQVNKLDNHDDHLAKIAIFKTSPEYMAMTPEMQSGIEQHARNHIGEKMKQGAQNGGPGVPGPVGGFPPGMAGPPNHAPLPQGPVPPPA